MVDAVVTRARTWATVAFAVQGLMQALVLTNLPGLEERTGIGDTEVGLVVLSRRWSSRRLARSSAARWRCVAARRSCWCPRSRSRRSRCCSRCCTFPTRRCFPVYALFGLGVGLGDAGNGMQGLTIQRAYGRPIFTTFYAFQTAAAIVGALVVAGINGDRRPL